jgi:hypothetical protein
MPLQRTDTKAKKPVAGSDKEAVRMLAIEVGAREAARRLGLNEDTVCTWSKRYKWRLPKRNGFQQLATVTAAIGREANARAPEALLASHKELETATRSDLMRAAREAAATAAQNDCFAHSTRFSDVTAAAARLFGWDKGTGSGVTLNQLVVTQEQLQQIRALREA